MNPLANQANFTNILPDDVPVQNNSEIHVNSTVKIKQIRPKQMKKLLKDPDNKILCSIVMLPNSNTSATEIKLNNLNIFNENERNDENTKTTQMK
jgi:hypothetical protein